MNMFKPSKATTVKEYIDLVPDERKEMFEYLHKFIQKSVPKLKPHFATNMIGYGSFAYRNYKHEPIEWPVVSLANQKNHVSIYICSILDGKYLAEHFADSLGKVKVGKSCISIKKLEDIDLPTLKKVLQMAEKAPGFGPIK
jgi:hypothetical protein